VPGGTARRGLTHQGKAVKSVVAKETTMLHPYITEALVDQRRAALHAEASHARLAGQLRPRARGDPARARFTIAIAARTFVRQLRAIVVRA
jgi:hypothetical protein